MYSIISLKGNIEVRVDGHLVRKKTPPMPAAAIEEIIEEVKEEEMPQPDPPKSFIENFAEEKKVIFPLLSPKRQLQDVSPAQPEERKLIEFAGEKLKLKLPGLDARGRGFIRNMFEEALNEHEQIPIPKRHWVYKLVPSTIKDNDREREFMFCLPYCFATAATPEALKRGLLETIEFRQDDECLSALRMTFNNGSQEQQCVFGRRLFLDKTIMFGSSVKKITLTYNVNVISVEFNDDEQAYAFSPQPREAADQVKKFFLKPGQQIVGVYGKLDRHHDDITWFNFILAKPQWQKMGSNALSL